MFSARPKSGNSFRSLTFNTPLPGPNTSRENLVLGAAPLGDSTMPQPTVPDVGSGGFSDGGLYGGYGAQDQRAHTNNSGWQPAYGQGSGGYGYRGYGGY